jgi:hypothetical protein
MTAILRFVQLLSLGTWTGATLFVGLLLAPGAFATLPTRELAGNVVGLALTRLHLLGYVCAALYLGSGVAGGGLAALRKPAAVLVTLMLLFTAVAHQGLTPRLADLRGQMAAAHGSIDATPRDHPLRLQFGRLHGVANVLELVILLLGLAAFFLAVRNHG